MAKLTTRDIEDGLRDIGRKARAAGEIIEIAVYGGSAIVLVFKFRRATRDVEVVVTGDASRLRRHARAMARERAGTRTG
jgi:hypothetical protein